MQSSDILRYGAHGLHVLPHSRLHSPPGPPVPRTRTCGAAGDCRRARTGVLDVDATVLMALDHDDDEVTYAVVCRRKLLASKGRSKLL